MCDLHRFDQGQVALKLFPTIADRPSTGVPQLEQVGLALYGAGLVLALLLWGLGVWWLLIGVATFIRERRRGKLPFNVSFSKLRVRYPAFFADNRVFCP